MDDEIIIQETAAGEALQHEQALSLITRAEIDTQIATARAFPRSVKGFLMKAQSMACVSQGVAESCTYALPRGGGAPLQGPSVRLAEIVVAAYGNIRAGARVIHNDGKTVTSQGICHDLENNTCITVEVKRSILQNIWETGQDGKRRKTGRMETMKEDMQVVTGNAANAIAFRNAVFKVVPAALIQEVYEKVQNTAKGTLETLPANRAKAIAYCKEKGITEAQICDVLEVKFLEDIDLEKMNILRGMLAALKNGEATLEELFPKPEPKAKATAAEQATEEAIKKAGKAAGK